MYRLDSKVIADKQIVCGELKHLLGTDGISKEILNSMFESVDKIIEEDARGEAISDSFSNIIVANLFFENSTRTRTTFEIAAKKLNMRVINFDVDRSSTSKGETLMDTISNLAAMGCNIFIVRHSSPGMPLFVANNITEGSVINAGDGRHSHPTQALLDLYTIRQYKKDISKLKVAIVGDINNSRVARSLIDLLSVAEVKQINLIAPLTLLPNKQNHLADAKNINYYKVIEEGIADVDVVILLRLQNERMSGLCVPSKERYFEQYGINNTNIKLAKNDAIIMHPGPVNWNVEIADEFKCNDKNVILNQVNNGIFVRMHILKMLANLN
jgi:aspartate carbamoyltransferase catalytic subunit